MIKPKVLFLCSGNSCRTQMAEAFLSDLAGDRFEITSAGSEATPLDPDAIAAMRELGIDISRHQSKSVTSYLGQRFTFVITLCDRQPVHPALAHAQRLGMLKYRVLARRRVPALRRGHAIVLPSEGNGSRARQTFAAPGRPSRRTE